MYETKTQLNDLNKNMKKLLFLSFAMICLGRSNAELPNKLKVVIPQNWSVDVGKFLDLNLYDISNSDTLAGKICIYSPDGVHLSTIFCSYFPETEFLERVLNSSYNSWYRLKDRHSYSSLTKHKL